MSTFTLTGSGTQAVSSPGSLALVVTVFPSFRGDGRATPGNHYDIGLLRLGTAHGYLPAFPVDATNQVIPCPAGVTSVGYTMLGGATVTIEERPETLGQAVATSITIPQPLVITPNDAVSLGVLIAAFAVAAPTSGAYVAVSRCMYYPFRLTSVFTSAVVFLMNGSVVSGHFDIGVYDSAGNRLASTGSTVQSGTSAIQSVALVVTLQPGNYYLALSVDNTTAQVFSHGPATAAIGATFGIRSQASTFPLPTTATFAGTPAAANIYLVGIASVSVP